MQPFVNNPRPIGRKVLHVPTNALFDVLPVVRLQQYARVLKTANLPLTARPIAVYHDYARDSFAVIIEDESFPQNTPGIEIEEIVAEWQWVELQVK